MNDDPHNDCLKKFCTELERLIDGHGTHHAIHKSSGATRGTPGRGHWYWATQVPLDDDPVQAPQAVAGSDTNFPTSI